MTYRIQALPLDAFVPFFSMSDSELAIVGARRWVADQPGRAPCRVSLRDADAGERLVLVNHAHLTDPTSPYRAAGPIFVREAAIEDVAHVAVGLKFRHRGRPVQFERRSGRRHPEEEFIVWLHR